MPLKKKKISSEHLAAEAAQEHSPEPRGPTGKTLLKALRMSSLKPQDMNSPDKPPWVSLCSWGCRSVAHPRVAPPLTEEVLPQMLVGLIRRDTNRA